MAQGKLKRSVSDVEDELSRIEEEIRRHKRSVESGRPVSLRVPAATVIEKEIKKEIKKEEYYLLSGKTRNFAFYFFTSLVATAVLAYLFGSLASGVFYFCFGLFLWWWSHQFHATKSGFLKSFISMGILVAVLYFFTWVFADLMSIIVTLLYALSFFIGAVLYLYHTKRELTGEIHRSFPRTFLVMFYTHIIAFAAASVVAYLIPAYLLSDSFVSAAFLFVAWLLPSLFVYFFLTKFLYLRFFDMKHMQRDILEGFLHGIAYSVAFVVLLLLAYLLTAMQLVGMERAESEGIFSEMFTSLPNVRSGIVAFAAVDDDAQLLGLQVTQDIIAMSEGYMDNATREKASLDSSQLSFSDYFDDNYMSVLSGRSIGLSHLSSVVSGISGVKDDLLSEYSRVKEGISKESFDDGSVRLDTNYENLASFMRDRYVPFQEPIELSMVRDRYSSSGLYSSMFGDGMLLDFNTAYDSDAQVLVAGDSRFSKRFYDVLYHTVLYREMMHLLSDNILITAEDALDPYAVRMIRNPAPAESILSKVVRYRIVKANIEASLSA
jgi:hypothetical protein